MYLLLAFLRNNSQHLLLRDNAICQRHSIHLLRLAGSLAGNPISGEPTSCGRTDARRPKLV